jgi:hypothetical protein
MRGLVEVIRGVVDDGGDLGCGLPPMKVREVMTVICSVYTSVVKVSGDIAVCS